MSERMCRKCRCAPVACESLCVVCLRDKLAADKAANERERREWTRRRREARKPGPGWDRMLVRRVLRP